MDLKEQIYWAASRFIDDAGYSPSFDELAKACKCSKVAVHYHLGKLKAEGRIDYVPGKPRTLVLLEDA